MREIKFRAWYWGKMVQPDYIDSCWDACMSYLYEDTPCEEDYPVMQYTWLKDFNGKEIYEGDVIKNFLETQIVRFWEAEVNPDSLWVTTTIIWFYLEDLDWNSVDIYMGKVEILWNVYENPELLEFNS